MTTSHSAMTPVVPLFLGVPGFINGRLSLGEVVQLSLAFIQVQTAMVWFADNYTRLAEWRASALRLFLLAKASGIALSPPDPRVPMASATFDT